MNHYRLLTALPPLPSRPGRPAVSRSDLVAQCREDLDEASWAAIEAVLQLETEDLDDTTETDETTAVAHYRERVGQAQALVEEAGSGILEQWLTYDQALKEALAAARATKLGRPWPAPSPEVADAAATLAPAVTRAMDAPDPLARQRAVDTMRLEALDQMLEGDPFATDAVLARLVAASIVDLWDFSSDSNSEGDPLGEVWT